MRRFSVRVSLHRFGTHLVVSRTFQLSNGSGSPAQKLARAGLLQLYGGRYRGLPRACGIAAEPLASP